MITFNLRGVDDVVDRLSELPEKVAKAGVRRAARKAMSIVRDAAKARARAIDDPNTPMNIADFIEMRESPNSGKAVGGIVMRVGVAGGATYRRGATTPTYWRYVEFGTERSRARPFMRPALEKNVSAVTNTFVTDLIDTLDHLP